LQQTTQGTGFHSVNNAMDLFANQTVEASDRQLMADLAATNKALTKQLAEKDSIIAGLRSNSSNNQDRHGNNDCNQLHK
jgi:hypothetical protein